MLAPDGAEITSAPVNRHVDNAMVKAIAAPEEVAGGTLDAEAWDHYLRDVAYRVAALRDSPRAMVAWHQERLGLGLG